MDEPRKYRDIATDLQTKIESGELAAGQRLPSDAELGAEYGASRNTVREAIRFLLNRGLVQKQSGGGTYVPKKIDPFRTVINADTGFGGYEGAAYASDVISKNRRPTVTTPLVQLKEAPAEIAGELQLSPGATVVIRHQERSIDGELWSMQTSFYPYEFVRRGADGLLEVRDMPEGVRRYLDRTLGIKEIGSRDRMTVRAPTREEAAAFKISDDGRIAVFETRQTGVDVSRQPVRVTITVYPADRNEFAMETGALADRAGPEEDS